MIQFTIDWYSHLNCNLAFNNAWDHWQDLDRASTTTFEKWIKDKHNINVVWQGSGLFNVQAEDSDYMLFLLRWS